MTRDNRLTKTSRGKVADLMEKFVDGLVRAGDQC